MLDQGTAAHPLVQAAQLLQMGLLCWWEELNRSPADSAGARLGDDAFDQRHHPLGLLAQPFSDALALLLQGVRDACGLAHHLLGRLDQFLVVRPLVLLFGLTLAL